MPNWKKVILSGSNAELNTLNVVQSTTSSTALITSDIEIQGTLTDSNSNVGGSGQILSSTVTGIDWVDASAVIGGPYLKDTTDTFTGTLTVAGTMAATTVTGANVTSGVNPGHTHTGASISALDAGDTTTGTFASARLPEATATAKGAIELFSNTDNPTAANTVSSTTNRTYGLQLNAAGQGVINVPWTDTQNTYTATLVAGTGLAGTTYTPSAGSTFNLDFSELTDMTGDITGTTEFILQDSTTESRKAASEIKLGVLNNDQGWEANVDTNLTVGTVTATNVPIESSTGTNITTLPAATATLAGIVTNGTQEFGGQKTFGIIRTVDIRTSNGTQVAINAGESSGQATGQTGEIVYINAEGGLQVNSSPDNWSTGWAARNVTTINDTSGNSNFANDITVSGGGITLSGTGRIQGIDTVSATTDAANKAYVDAHTSGVDGTGTTNYIPKWSDSDTLTDSIVFDDGTSVGIGTASPDAQLHSNVAGGSINYGMFTIDTDTWLNLFTGTGIAPGAVPAGQGALYWKSGSVFRLGTSTSTDGFGFVDMVRIDENGNVGIGTTSPGTKLHVGAGSSATVDAGYQIVAESAGIAGIQILSATNQSGRVVFGDSGDNDIGMIKYDHTDNSMGFRTNGSGNERMRIDSAGNVGIGTTTPGVRLTTVTETPSSGPTLGSGSFGSQALLASNGLYGQYSGVSNNGDVWHQVQRNDGDAAMYNMILQPSGGLVGIGTAAPISNGGPAAGLLHINGGNTWAATHYTNTSTGAGTGDGGVIAQIITDLEIFNYEAGEVRISTNGSRAITIDSSQNVGIGTATPNAAYKLEVTGDASITGSLTISGSQAYKKPTANNEFTGEIVTFGSYFEATSAGELVCLGASQVWNKANQNNATDATGMLGIAMGSNPSDGILLRGFARTSTYNDSNGYTNGGKVYIKNTNGDMTSTIPGSQYVRIVGYVVETTTPNGTLYFCPDNTYIFIPI